MAPFGSEGSFCLSDLSVSISFLGCMWDTCSGEYHVIHGLITLFAYRTYDRCQTVGMTSTGKEEKREEESSGEEDEGKGEGRRPPGGKEEALREPESKHGDKGYWLDAWEEEGLWEVLLEKNMWKEGEQQIDRGIYKRVKEMWPEARVIFKKKENERTEEERQKIVEYKNMFGEAKRRRKRFLEVLFERKRAELSMAFHNQDMDLAIRAARRLLKRRRELKRKREQEE